MNLKLILFFILISQSYSSQLNEISAKSEDWDLQFDSTSNDQIYVGLVDLNTREYENFLTKYKNRLKAFKINLGKLNCDYMKENLKNFDQISDYCTERKINKDNHLLLIRNKRYMNKFEYTMLQNEYVLLSNLLELNLNLNYQNIYLNDLKSCQQVLFDALNEEKMKNKNLVLVNLANIFIGQTQSMDPILNRVELLEVIYQCSSKEKFIIVNDNNIMNKIANSLTNDTFKFSPSIIAFDCKEKDENCDSTIYRENLNKNLLLRAINQLEFENEIKRMNNHKEIEDFLDKISNRDFSIIIFIFNNKTNKIHLEIFKHACKKYKQSFLMIELKNDSPAIGVYLSFMNHFIPNVFEITEKDNFEHHLIMLIEYLKSYHEFYQFNQGLSKFDLEPNDFDDENIQFELPDEKDGMKMIELIKSLKTDFKVLTEQNFHDFVKSSKLSLIFFHLPYERVSINNAFSLMKMAKVWNDDSSDDNIFAQINCFDYSQFCTKSLKIQDFPSLHIYKNGKLVEEIKYVPEEFILIEKIHFYLSKNPILLDNRTRLDEFFDEENFIDFEFKHLEHKFNRLARKYGFFNKDNKILRRLVLYLHQNDYNASTILELEKRLQANNLNDHLLLGCIKTDQKSRLIIKSIYSVFRYKFSHSLEIDLDFESIDYSKKNEKIIDNIIQLSKRNSPSRLINYNHPSRINLIKKSKALNILLLISNETSYDIINAYFDLSISRSNSEINFFWLDVSIHSNNSFLLYEYTKNFSLPKIILINFQSKIQILVYKDENYDLESLKKWLNSIERRKEIEYDLVKEFKQDWLPLVPPYDYLKMENDEKINAEYHGLESGKYFNEHGLGFDQHGNELNKNVENDEIDPKINKYHEEL